MRCLIVDDDPLICDLLAHFCSKVESISNVTVTNSGFESVNLIGKNNFDVILLDFDLPDITGKDILQLINDDTAVIMVTAHKDFASESYEYDQVVDFLVKPIEFARFHKGIQKALSFYRPGATEEPSLFVKDGTKLIKVDLSKVLFIKSAGNYAELILTDKKVLTLVTLKDLQEKLPRYFQRVHRSCIVNIHKIESISGGELTIMDHVIAVSASYEKDLLNKIRLLS